MTALIPEQRIEALEAELAALRASTYDKETINILVHTITRNDEAEDSIEDLKNAADMLKGKSILDALNAEYDNAAELATCKRDAERWRFSVTIGENQSMNWLDVYDDWDGEGDFTAAIDAAMAAGE